MKHVANMRTAARPVVVRKGRDDNLISESKLEAETAYYLQASIYSSSSSCELSVAVVLLALLVDITKFNGRTTSGVMCERQICVRYSHVILAHVAQNCHLR